ncbi:MAG: hypothetical protein M3Y48_14045 [Actinomycetota bacterium]|nr:hypothetical protein [Actinomycetota bacterium]
MADGDCGQVAAIPATVGEQVQSGQTLATVDAASLPRQLAKAHAAVASAVAKVAADRTAGASDAQVNADDAALVSANAQLAVAQQNLSKATLTAPFAGTVAAVTFTMGQEVSGTSSAGSGGGSGGGSTGAAAPGGSGLSSVAAASTTSASNAQVVVISTGSYVVNASVDDTEPPCRYRLASSLRGCGAGRARPPPVAPRSTHPQRRPRSGCRCLAGPAGPG